MENTTEVRATIRALEESFAWVEVEQGGCGRCHEAGGCGGQQLSQVFCGKPKTYRVSNDLHLSVGDKVVLGLSADAIRQSANLAYALPLAALLGGALFGMYLAADIGAIAGGGLGLVTAWLFVRHRLNPNSGHSVPIPQILYRV